MVGYFPENYRRFLDELRRGEATGDCGTRMVDCIKQALGRRTDLISYLGFKDINEAREELDRLLAGING